MEKEFGNRFLTPVGTNIFPVCSKGFKIMPVSFVIRMNSGERYLQSTTSRIPMKLTVDLDA